MYAEKNPSKYALETLQHELADAIENAMYTVLDKTRRAVIANLERLIESIPPSP